MSLHLCLSSLCFFLLFPFAFPLSPFSLASPSLSFMRGTEKKRARALRIEKRMGGNEREGRVSKRQGEAETLRATEEKREQRRAQRDTHRHTRTHAAGGGKRTRTMKRDGKKGVRKARGQGVRAFVCELCVHKNVRVSSVLSAVRVCAVRAERSRQQGDDETRTW